MNGLPVNVSLPSWCCGCPYLDPETTVVYAENLPYALNIYCQHTDRCQQAAQGACQTAYQWISVEERLPDLGEMVLCVMKADGFWFPRFGQYTAVGWRFMLRRGSYVNFDIKDISHWLPILPPYEIEWKDGDMKHGL